MSNLEMFFRVRGPAYKLIEFINHKYSTTRQEFEAVVEQLKRVESAKAWLKSQSVPKNCRVDETNTVLFDAFLQYLTTFFTTSLEIKRRVSCGICQIYHHKLGPAKLTPESRKRATRLLDNTLSQICIDEHLEKPQSIQKFSKDLTYVTYCIQSAKRVTHQGAGQAIHALWQKLSAEDKSNITLQEFNKRRNRLVKSIQESQNP